MIMITMGSDEFILFRRAGFYRRAGFVLPHYITIRI